MHVEISCSGYFIPRYLAAIECDQIGQIIAYAVFAAALKVTSIESNVYFS